MLTVILGVVDTRDSRGLSIVIQGCLLKTVMGVLDRVIFRDDQWDRISAHIIGDGRKRGSPWRDLPDVFDGRNSVFPRFSRWSHKGAIAVIPNDPSRPRKCPLDKRLHARRHLMECCFSRLEQFRRVVT